jgi:hypothetical protein
LEVREERGRLVMSKKRTTRDALDELYGILKLGRSTDDHHSHPNAAAGSILVARREGR